MNMTNRSVSKTYLGIALAMTTFAMGLADAETYRQRGSTATIQQSGGGGTIESRIIRYRDGQKIITRDGNSTDITFQRSGRPLPSDGHRTTPKSGDDRLARRFEQDRFQSPVPDYRSPADCEKSASPYLRDTFRRRMLERMAR